MYLNKIYNSFSPQKKKKGAKNYCPQARFPILYGCKHSTKNAP